jgi:site-specific recombinase XerD
VSGKPSRTHTSSRRMTAERAEALPVAWSSVREMYPQQIRDRVDQLAEKGGVTLRDLSAMTTAQLLVDLAEQRAGGTTSRQVAAGLRLLFRLAVVTGGIGDGATAMVQVPKELIDLELPVDDLGDEVTD